MNDRVCGVIQASGIRCGEPLGNFNPDGGEFHCHVLPTIEFHLDGRVSLNGEPWAGAIVNYALAEHLAILASSNPRTLEPRGADRKLRCDPPRPERLP